MHADQRCNDLGDERAWGGPVARTHTAYCLAPVIGEFGRREWHALSGYGKRSLVENTMYRYKTIIGRSMRSRTLDGQRNETQLASKILNTMISFGIPNSYQLA